MPQAQLAVLLAQINSTVGDLSANSDKIMHIIATNQEQHDIILFPELALCGYPLEDLLFRKELYIAINKHLKQIQALVKDCYVVLGFPTEEHGHHYNTVLVLHQGKELARYHKQKLPNYGVFDEYRYFTAGVPNPCILEIKGHKLGLCICEDIWQPGPVEELIAQQVSTILVANASPFDMGKYNLREQLLKFYASKGVNIIYVNQICGQDELLFDGQSLVIDKNGSICARLAAFEEQLATVNLTHKQLSGPIAPLLSTEALMYKALVCATHDYVHKNHFPGVLIGLSGGIDSALTLAIAVDALGADKVQAVMMPSRYSLPISQEDALTQLQRLQVAHTTLSIEPAFNAYLSTLESAFKGLKPDITEENIQARIRGMLLMALSNKTGKMVLTTSNKSETAVGYATLYGDMAGGFAPLKDVLKTQVYALARYRNSIAEVIPTRVLQRAPTAELRPDQTDQDNLPEYSILDAIIVGYMQENLSAAELIKKGFAASTVNKIIALIKRNEYKRRQAAPGPKISELAFGKDWRYPLTNGFVE